MPAVVLALAPTSPMPGMPREPSTPTVTETLASACTPQFHALESACSCELVTLEFQPDCQPFVVVSVTAIVTWLVVVRVLVTEWALSQL